ncbi:MAG: hypothetical protein JSR64_12835 [Nitrospira sp.]|nr:hypothetical protein [Nitrospira sp.]
MPDLPEIVIDPPVAPSNGVSRAGLADATARAMLEANTASRVIAAETEQPAGAQPQILRNEPQPLLVFSGGRGYARMAELGLGGSIGNLLDVFLVPLPTEGEDGRRGEQD